MESRVRGSLLCFDFKLQDCDHISAGFLSKCQSQITFFIACCSNRATRDCSTRGLVLVPDGLEKQYPRPYINGIFGQRPRAPSHKNISRDLLLQGALLRCSDRAGRSARFAEWRWRPTVKRRGARDFVTWAALCCSGQLQPSRVQPGPNPSSARVKSGLK